MLDKNAITNAAQKYAARGQIDDAIAEWSKLTEVSKDGNIKVVHGTVSRDELIMMYQSSDVAVLPSKWEGIGLTTLESLACGLPVITVDAAPMNEFVIDSHNGGFSKF